MSWVKSDGAKIKITFDEPLTGTVSGNETHFTVTVPEYTFVPGGTIVNVTKTVASTGGLLSVDEIVDLSGGTKTDVVYENNALSLGVA